MRVLIHDYTTRNSTQATYFGRELNRLDGVTCGLWDYSGSLYDVMDQFKPETFITHCSKITNDLITYIKDTETPPLKKLIVVVNNLRHQAIIDCMKVLNEAGYENYTFLTNNIKHLNKAPDHTVYLPEACDVHLVSQIHTEYKINTCVVVDKLEEVGQLPSGSCHIVSTNAELQGKVDICQPISVLSKLWKNYRNVSIRYNCLDLPQMYFDAVVSGANVTFDNENPHCKDRIRAICSRVFECDCNSGKNDTIKDIISNKHLSTNRLQTVLGLLPPNGQVQHAHTNGKYFEI